MPSKKTLELLDEIEGLNRQIREELERPNERFDRAVHTLDRLAGKAPSQWQYRLFLIHVRKNGELLLRRFGETPVLAHEQIGLDTKPWLFDDFMEAVRSYVWEAWREMIEP